ncbi:hypothetical protein QYE76_044699 [Lolium multiflorum]|uniref:Uncharacterized protein n=1 Tax=Lolium multiflorum TaxID=4521 RepID=A0AAD8WZ43_LOLMU|nr:hypothetical protein QYE76_044699 [Lolium multiflorum]
MWLGQWRSSIERLSWIHGRKHISGRGLSLYYLDRFEDAAEQFRLDVAQNPNDTEESIWCFLCEAQLYGVEEARKRFLEVGLDRRPVMREAYALFKDGGDPEKVILFEVECSGGRCGEEEAGWRGARSSGAARRRGNRAWRGQEAAAPPRLLNRLALDAVK